MPHLPNEPIDDLGRRFDSARIHRDTRILVIAGGHTCGLHSGLEQSAVNDLVCGELIEQKLLSAKGACDILLLSNQAQTQNRWGAVHDGVDQHLWYAGGADAQPAPCGAFHEHGGLRTRFVVRIGLACGGDDSARVITEPNPSPQRRPDLFDQLAQRGTAGQRLRQRPGDLVGMA
jgi:hypothetical protein